MTKTGTPPTELSLDFHVLTEGYKAGTLRPSDVVNLIYDRIEARGDDHVWIYLVDRADALAEAAKLEAEGYDGRPLWGIPFSIKDCNDVIGLPTTNALKEGAYVATSTGQVVTRIFDAGAILIGKTNMDQFGIGLVGMRSPYGDVDNAFNPDYISGGSSSGSGISVAAGLSSFSIANDAAGSGRVPAGFNNIVGIKPTPGLLSNACVSGGGCLKTAETVSIYSLTVEDGMQVMDLVAGYDPSYPFSRKEADLVPLNVAPVPPRFKFGIPKGKALEFYGDKLAEAAFHQAVDRLKAMGGEVVEVEFTPFDETQKLLYDGPWISERAISMDKTLEQYRDAIHPITRQILEKSGTYSAGDTFAAIHRIAELKCETRPVWDEIAFLLVPTTPTIYTHQEIRDNPIELNSRLGIYTNFVNLMGLCGIAVPNGLRQDGLPTGVTLLAPGDQEARIAGYAAAFHRQTGVGLGKALSPYPSYDTEDALPENHIEIAVVGAHLAGMPLNHELTERGGQFRRAAKTAKGYRLFALSGTVPAKPGLVRDETSAGKGIDIEIWSLPAAGFGDFVSRIPAPLGIGKLSLEDGSEVSGFLCEQSALADATDITSLGGWRAFIAQQ